MMTEQSILEQKLSQIFNAIKNDPANVVYTAQKIEPLYAAAATAKILLIGQAPGKKAQATKRCWNDQSGVRLRKWMGVTTAEFYDSTSIAILPADFYYPGKGKHGDLPPRRGFAAKWHPQLLKLMPNIQLSLLIGSYAQHEYLELPKTVALTEVVHNYQNYLPKYFPLVHPSPLNGGWLKRNPWFEEKVVPTLKKRVRQILNEKD